MIRRIAVALGLAALIAAPAAAQVPALDIRVGAHATLPSADLADAQTTGYGAYGRLGAPVGPLKLFASATWNQFKGEGGAPDTDVTTLTVGPHFSLIPMLDIGIEGGLFFGDNDSEFGLSPNVSIALMKFDVTVQYNTTTKDPKATWINAGVGFRF